LSNIPSTWNARPNFFVFFKCIVCW
jgi:hypothetical protein